LNLYRNHSFADCTDCLISLEKSKSAKPTEAYVQVSAMFRCHLLASFITIRVYYMHFKHVLSAALTTYLWERKIFGK